jgi:F0F1-type ATP synthase delta subunit
VDEALVGGIVAIIGDRQWDRSVRRQLEQARRLVGA